MIYLKNESCLRTYDIIDAITDDVALVLLSGVHYFTGQFMDIKNITKAAHTKVELIEINIL